VEFVKDKVILEHGFLRALDFPYQVFHQRCIFIHWGLARVQQAAEGRHKASPSPRFKTRLVSFEWRRLSLMSSQQRTEGYNIFADCKMRMNNFVEFAV
jgi:hypothetical protein